VNIKFFFALVAIAFICFISKSYSQTISHADIDSSVSPVRLYIEIEHPSLAVVGGTHASFSDSVNSQIFIINFQGCEDGPLVVYDTFFDISVAYPFALRINAVRLPMEGCAYPEEVTLTDTLVRPIPTLGFDKIELQSSLVTISPNPTYDYLNLTLAENTTLKEILISNNLGTLVLRSSTKNIDITSMPSGVYYAKIITDKGNRTLKFIKR
jgi:hypothetical protein